MLTEEQLACFRTFGFVLLRQLFNRDEQQIISDEYERGLEFARAGATPVRSEERRGGKECRSRWAPYH